MLLPWLILIPFIGGLLCFLTEKTGPLVPRWIALFTMLLEQVLGGEIPNERKALLERLAFSRLQPPPGLNGR